MNLLPCPFCGSRNIDPEGWASTKRKGPACDDCGASADTVEVWNTRPEEKKLRAALIKIESWFGEFPETNQFWDRDRREPMSYAAAYGSNGERDYMRGIARNALSSNGEHS